VFNFPAAEPLPPAQAIGIRFSKRPSTRPAFRLNPVIRNHLARTIRSAPAVNKQRAQRGVAQDPFRRLQLRWCAGAPTREWKADEVHSQGLDLAAFAGGLAARAQIEHSSNS